jgi:hypothetical protein
VIEMMDYSTVASRPLLERFLIARLARFAKLANQADGSEITPWCRLARAATLSAYRDCVDVRLDRAARDILSQARDRARGSGTVEGNVMVPGPRTRSA